MHCVEIFFFSGGYEDMSILWAFFTNLSLETIYLSPELHEKWPFLFLNPVPNLFTSISKVCFFIMFHNLFTFFIVFPIFFFFSLKFFINLYSNTFYILKILHGKVYPKLGIYSWV